MSPTAAPSLNQPSSRALSGKARSASERRRRITRWLSNDINFRRPFASEMPTRSRLGRHSRATELRPYGLDVARTVLGHSKVETTEVYAEKDLAAAMELMGRIG